jgi:hypothetical protein
VATKKHQQRAQSAVLTSQEVACSVPIFTKEFVQFNKAREEEIRHLRRLNQQLEQQNQALYNRVRCGS